MKYAKMLKSLGTALFLLSSSASLSGCGPTSKTSGIYSVDTPYVPEPETAYDSDVVELLESQREALKSCNANFEIE